VSVQLLSNSRCRRWVKAALCFAKNPLLVA
jgi:hypothetical protein